jgi:hypothetical protein
MAHDISFHPSRDEKPFAYFFGYCEGVWYQALDCEQFDGGVSGTNEGLDVDYHVFTEALKWIEEQPEVKSYPDPTRFPDALCTIRNALRFCSTIQPIYVHFS